jgi:tRNA-dihydrouridine synthase
MSFWQQIQKPIVGLSPMDGITDAAFRYTMASTAKPDIIFTEFVNADGIIKGGEQVLRPLYYHQIERPIVAQLFGLDPEMFYQATKVLCELGFDGVDINMGCPSKTVSGRGAGAGLIRTPQLAKEITIAVQNGVSDWVTNGLQDLPEKVIKKVLVFKESLKGIGVIFQSERIAVPVSIKTRIGHDADVVESWVAHLMENHPANITVHGRLLKQMYGGKADWEAIKRAAAVVRQLSLEEKPTSILGNGDVNALSQIPTLQEQYGVDGVLIGRATFGNPWFFENLAKLKAKESFNDDHSFRPYQEIKAKLLEHLAVYDKLFGETAFVSQRKHMGWYLKGFENAAALRVELMKTENFAQVKKILTE